MNGHQKSIKIIKIDEINQEYVKIDENASKIYKNR